MQADPTANIDLAMVVIRGIVLIVAALGGVLSIYFGWKLYRDGLASAVSAEASRNNSWAFKMRAVGPGVFFALFGAALLVYLTRQEMAIQSATDPPAEIVPVPAKQLTSAGPRVPMATPQAQSAAAPLPAVSAAEPRPTPGRPACRCQTRIIRRFSDGRRLSPESIRTALSNAETLLGKLDRSSLSLAEQVQLENTLTTFGQMRTVTR
jgi:hypothetical protein